MRLTKQQAELLRLLQKDGSLSHEAVADALGKSRQAVGRDLKALEDAKIIKHKTIVIDPHKIGLTTTVYVLVELKTHGDGLLDLFEKTVREHFPNVVEFAHILGRWDLLLKFVVRDSTHLAEVHRQLTNTPNVSRTCSYGVLGAPKLYALPIRDESDR